MPSVGNIRPLRPLFASISHTFGDFSKRIKVGIWHLGASLLNLAYRGAIFDNDITFRPEDSTEDDFDIILDASEKICIRKPIIRPHILGPVVGEIRPQSDRVLTQNTLSPCNQGGEKVEFPTNRKNNPSPELPVWMKKWATDESHEEDEQTSNATDLENVVDLARGDGSAAPPTPVKRRLKRAISDFDKDAYTHHERNHQRTCLTWI